MPAREIRSRYLLMSFGLVPIVSATVVLVNGDFPVTSRSGGERHVVSHLHPGDWQFAAAVGFLYLAGLVFILAGVWQVRQRS